MARITLRECRYGRSDRRENAPFVVRDDHTLHCDSNHGCTRAQTRTLPPCLETQGGVVVEYEECRSCKFHGLLMSSSDSSLHWTCDPFRCISEECPLKKKPQQGVAELSAETITQISPLKCG